MEIPYYIYDIFMMVGGLGLFLYGMKMLMDGLENLAGSRMRTFVERATSNRFLGIMVGALVTIAIQSSTATSVMAIGFINAGLMTLVQAISLIMGAHIGTTFTAHIFTFRIDTFAPLFIFIGLVMYLFVKKKSVKNWGFVLLSIGILFFGISMMGEPLGELAQTPRFRSILTAFENPFLAVLSGFVFSAIIQSSTAATGILVTLYMRGAGLDFAIAAYLILGISVGTTITAFLASLAGRRESKRAALANLIYVSVGCIIFGVLLSIFPGILLWFQSRWADGARQIAMFYTFFKVGLTIMFLPFVKHLAALMYIIVPKQEKSADSKTLLYIKTDKVQTPAIAFEQAYNELKHMGEMTLGNLELAIDTFFTGNSEKLSIVMEVESSINYLYRQITTRLIQVQNEELTVDIKELSTLLCIASDFERIGDHAVNIVEYDMRKKGSQELRLSQEAIEELTTLSDAVREVLTLSMKVLDNHSGELIRLIYDKEQNIDGLCKEYIENHIMRLKNEKGDPRGSVIFVSMIADLERCADHANNIAHYFMDKSAEQAGT